MSTPFPFNIPFGPWERDPCHWHHWEAVAEALASLQARLITWVRSETGPFNPNNGAVESRPKTRAAALQRHCSGWCKVLDPVLGEVVFDATGGTWPVNCDLLK